MFCFTIHLYLYVLFCVPISNRAPTVNKKSITLKNPRALASLWPLVPSIVQSLKSLTGNGEVSIYMGRNTPKRRKIFSLLFFLIIIFYYTNSSLRHLWYNAFFSVFLWDLTENISLIWRRSHAGEILGYWTDTGEYLHELAFYYILAKTFSCYANF